MKILWLGWEDAYTPQRMRSAAFKLGIELDTLEISELTFITAGVQVGVYHCGQDIVKTYELLIARTFYPYISEALTVARLFHAAGKRVVDASLTDEGFVVSKMHDYLILAQNGIRVPRTWQMSDTAKLAQIANDIGYPCVLKGIHGSHGTHVYLVHNDGELASLVSKYPRGELMLQEYLPAPEDYRLMVLGYHALPMMVCRQPAEGDFRTNVGLGHSVNARPVADYDGLAAMAEKSARVLRREFAGVDIRFQNNTPVVLEVNRRPIFENYETVTGIDVAGAFLKYVSTV
ncbi:MAG TPA: ATP-grasp domain-containing protein [Anaerolineae bacterium]